MERKQVSEMTGIPERRILFYTESGLLPSMKRDTGRGISREYSSHDVHILSIVKRLSVIGFSLKTIKEIIS